MSQSHASKQDDQQSDDIWTSGVKLGASIVIAFHVFALIIAPLAVPPTATKLATDTADLLRPYLRGVSIDNGYRFFAPNPGPSHIVRYEIDLANGETVQGQFPDRDRHWPRLLYHRYLMLSETVFSQAIPVANFPADGFNSQEDREQFDAARDNASLLLSGLARRLLAENRDANGARGRRIRIYSVTHRIPTIDEWKGGMKLDDPQLYLDAMAEPQVFELESKVPLAGYTVEELDAAAESKP